MNTHLYSGYLYTKLQYIMYITYRKWYIAKNRCFGLHLCRRKFRYIFNHFYAMHPGNNWIWWNKAK